MSSRVSAILLSLTAVFALTACETMGGQGGLNATNTASDTMTTEESSVIQEAVDDVN